MKKVALVGYGYWGPNLLRNFFETPGCEVLYCCDTQIQRLKEVRKKHPTIIVTTEYNDLLQDPELDAIIIATPTKYHFPLAKEAIEAGKDVLIEKPMVLSYKEAEALLKIAKTNGRLIMVDHTFLFNEAVIKTKEIVSSGELGDILYIDSTRANLGLIQKDSNAIFDLGTHDFSIIKYLIDTDPVYIQAFGKSHFNNQEDICYVVAEYPKNILVHLHSSWLSPLKIRKTIIVGTKKMLVYDDIESAEKIRIYEKGVSLEQGLTKHVDEVKIGYRTGDVWLPNIKIGEALSLVAKEFIKALETKVVPLSDGQFGADIVKIIEKSSQSLKSGKKVKISHGN